MPYELEPPTEEERADWVEWAKDRPAVVRAIAERINPWTIYELATTGQRVTLVAIAENGTVRVDVAAVLNPGLDFERTVFGISPDDMKPWAIPDDFEPGGNPSMSLEDVEANIDAIRVETRPDLFVMSTDGKAIRRQ